MTHVANNEHKKFRLKFSTGANHDEVLKLSVVSLWCITSNKFRQATFDSFYSSLAITLLLSLVLLIGAGPGGAFSYHGGGHGGRGGGFYQDRNTTRLYGWTYFDTTYLLGGSTGEIVLDNLSEIVQAIVKCS